MSTELVVAANYCSSCGHRLNQEDRFCAQCGRSINGIRDETTLPAVAGGTSISLSPEVKSIVGNRWVVIGLLAAVGPLGLPALWLSPRFRPWIKVAISLVYFFVTAFLPLLIAWYWFDYALQPLVDVFGR